MSATTVVTDDATIISEDDSSRRGRSSFSWGAALAGAFVATAVTFFLITLGSGIGLALITTPKLLHGQAPTFFMGGAIYFFVAQAFGFAAGGHLVGRLIGPAVETPKEEEFRAGAHGLGVWAIAVVATATMAAISAFVAEGSAPAAAGAYMSASKANSDLTPVVTGYWVDALFRAANPAQASLAWRQYAQAASTTGTDAALAPPAQSTTPQGDDESSGTQTVTPQDQEIAPTPSDTQISPATSSGVTAPATTTADGTMGTPAPGRNIGADKMEAGRILDVGMANGAMLRQDDRMQLAQLVSLDTGMNSATALRRVDDTTAHIRADEIKTAETARKVTMYASLWAALSLLFGAIVSVMAAVSARWEDDRITIFGR